jgi:hypothetical protein
VREAKERREDRVEIEEWPTSKMASIRNGGQWELICRSVVQTG